MASTMKSVPRTPTTAVGVFTLKRSGLILASRPVTTSTANAGQATREEQIVVAERVYAEYGLSGWGCKAHG